MSGAVQSPSTCSEFPFTFTIVGVLVKRGQVEVQASLPAEGSCCWHQKCVGPGGSTLILYNATHVSCLLSQAVVWQVSPFPDAHRALPSCTGGRASLATAIQERSGNQWFFPSLV